MTWLTWKIGLLPIIKFAEAANDVFQGGGNSFTLTNPLASCNDLSCIANAIIAALFTISIPIVSIMVLIGGFQILTAGGDPEKFRTGRKTIIYAVVGFAIILLAGGVVSLIRSLIH